MGKLRFGEVNKAFLLKVKLQGWGWVGEQAQASGLPVHSTFPIWSPTRLPQSLASTAGPTRTNRTHPYKCFLTLGAISFSLSWLPIPPRRPASLASAKAPPPTHLFTWRVSRPPSCVVHRLSALGWALDDARFKGARHRVCVCVCLCVVGGGGVPAGDCCSYRSSLLVQSCSANERSLELFNIF